MTAFHAIQCMVALAVLVLVAERSRSLLFQAPLSSGPFRRALVALLREGARERATALVRAALPSAIAIVVWPLLDPHIPDVDRRVEAHERLLDAEAGATRALRALRLSASIASALGFIGAAIEIRWVLAGSHGLLGLQAGLVESIGMGRAILAIAIGLATSSLAVGSWMVLRKVAADRVLEARRTLAAVGDVLG